MKIGKDNIGITILIGEYHKTKLEYEKAWFDMNINPNEYSHKVLEYLKPRLEQLELCLIALGYSTDNKNTF